MPIKNWTDGDYITAADLDEISRSVVMRFTSAANRDAVLVGDLAPRDGMTVFLADTQETLTYLLVSGTGYWAPQPGVTVCNVYQTAAQTLTHNTMSIVQLTGVVKNYRTWWSTSTYRFTPKVPGHYVLNGGVDFAANATGYRISLMRLNDTSSVAGSGAMLNAQPANNTTLPTRTTSIYLNGTTDYVTLNAMQTSGADLATIIASGYSASFHATYSGV